jgi:hypothetical protein
MEDIHSALLNLSQWILFFNAILLKCLLLIYRYLVQVGKINFLFSSSTAGKEQLMHKRCISWDIHFGS